MMREWCVMMLDDNDNDNDDVDQSSDDNALRAVFTVLYFAPE